MLSYQTFATFPSLFYLHTPINLPNSPGVFGHRAILIWGDQGMAGGFLEEQPVTLQCAEELQQDQPLSGYFHAKHC